MKKPRDIKKICIVGAGAMGRQIGFNCAMHGFNTYVTDSYEPSLTAAKKWADEYISGRIAKGRMTKEDAENTLAHLFFVDTLEDAASGCDLVIEAIVEVKEVKEELFRRLDKIAPTDAIITTNSSRMVSSMFKDCITDPSRLANLHYFNPALVMKLTEVVQGEHTSKETVDFLMEFSRLTGKEPIWLRKEIDGFVANRILGAITTEALHLVEQGICTPEEVDTAVEKGLNHPMGPFKVSDLVGLDISFDIKHRQFEDTGIKPVGYDMFKEKVERGELGRKVKKGWYDYN